MTLKPGTILIDRYQVVGRIGAGGMGNLWSGFDPNLDRYVAIKTMKDLTSSQELDPAAHARFHREAKIAAKLKHPGITVVHDFGYYDGQFFIVMELLEGKDLKALLREHPDGIPVAQALDLSRQVADALGAAHEKGIFHRDLKPANLFVLDGNRIKICDFGLAKTADATTTITRAGQIMGTPAYMPPEQWEGLPADERSDLYALGCILYEMLAGHPPFDPKDGLRALMAQHLNARPAPLPSTRKIPAELGTLVADLLAKDPTERRPATASTLEAEFRRISASLEPTIELRRASGQADGNANSTENTGTATASRHDTAWPQVMHAATPTEVETIHDRADPLQVGQVYTRSELREIFSISDATINNGVFPFREQAEIWLFVTEKKSRDQVQYVDRLTGDELQWQGQKMGRTDHLIVDHVKHGQRLRLFYRKKKNEHPGFGFMHEGEFSYISHVDGPPPTSFILRRATDARPESQLLRHTSLRSPDPGHQCTPRCSRDRQHPACPVGGVADQDPGRVAAHLYTLPAVGSAVSTGTPVGAVSFHSSSAVLAIMSREAPPGSASVWSHLKRSATRRMVSLECLDVRDHACADVALVRQPVLSPAAQFSHGLQVRDELLAPRIACEWSRHLGSHPSRVLALPVAAFTCRRRRLPTTCGPWHTVRG